MALAVPLQSSQSDLLIVGILGTLGEATAQQEATREHKEISEEMGLVSGQPREMSLPLKLAMCKQQHIKKKKKV